MKNMTTYNLNRGFSITELLIAILIIMILASILVPNVSRYAEKARVASCRTELENLAEAQARVATDMGYYARLHVLDDTKYEFIDEENLSDPPIERDRVFITINGHEILSKTKCDDIRERIDTSATLVMDWQGPYITIQDNEPQSGAEAFLHMIEIPDDPWGNDYLLVFPDGVLQEAETGTIDFEPDVVVDTYSGKAEDVFSRPVIYSLGPDGIPADPLGSHNQSSDDMWREFGY
jgi:prepilin-type N-terminal cleavage/methylation domain-containing protein